MTTTVVVPASQSYDGTQHTYTDDADPLTGLDGGGHVDRMIPIVKDVVSVANYTVNYVDANMQLSQDWATKLNDEVVVGEGYSAKQYALNAANYAAALIATSTSSVLISVGSKTFTTQTNKQFQAGQTLKIVSQANSNNYMIADVTSYSGTTLIVNVTSVGGSGTLADWNISLSGVKGDTGYATAFTQTTVTPTDGQTVFNIAYTVGLIEVYLNGVRLYPADYSASNGTTVTFNQSVNSTDQVMFVTFTSFTISDTLITANIGNTVQANLVSGTNIKTINNESLLGSGNISISVPDFLLINTGII